MYTALGSIPCREGEGGDSHLMGHTLGMEGMKSSEAANLQREVPVRAGGSKGNRKPNTKFEPRAGSITLRKGLKLPSPPEAVEGPVWRAPSKPRAALIKAKKLSNTARTYSPYIPKSKGYFGRTATFIAFGVSFHSIPTKAVDLFSAGFVFATGFGANVVAGLATSAKRSVFSLVSCLLMRENFAVHGLKACVRSLRPATISRQNRNIAIGHLVLDPGEIC